MLFEFFFIFASIISSVQHFQLIGSLVAPKDPSSALAYAQKSVKEISSDFMGRADQVGGVFDDFNATDLARVDAAKKEGKKLVKNSVDTALSDILKIYMNFIKRVITSDFATEYPGFQNSVNAITDQLKSVCQQIIDALSKSIEQIKTDVSTRSIKNTTEQVQKEFSSIQGMNAALTQQLFALVPIWLAVAKQAKGLAQKCDKSMAQEQNLFFNLLGQYVDLMQKFFSAYGMSGRRINFADQTNIVSILLRQTIDLFVNDIACTINFARALSKENKKIDYYQTLYNLAKRVDAIDGGIGKYPYVEFIASYAKTFLYIGQEQAVALYNEKKKNMTLSAYVDALQDFTLTVTNPSETMLTYARGFYQEILLDIPFLDQQRATTVSKLANINMGIIYSSFAESLIKQLSDKANNDQIIKKITDAYNNAINYFKKGNDEVSFQRATALLNFLQKAFQLEKDGDQKQASNDLISAIESFEQAYEFFLKVGDDFHAQKLNKKVINLQADQALQEAKKLFSDFTRDSSTIMQNYMLLISDQSLSRSDENGVDLINKMMQIFSKAIEYYQIVRQKYIIIAKSTDETDVLLSILQQLFKAGKNIQNGDQLALNASVDSLNMALNQYYTQAIALFAKADALYAQYPYIQQALVINPNAYTSKELNAQLSKGQNWNYVTFFQRHIARLCIDVAQQQQNQPFVAFQYYLAANGNRSVYLSSQMNQFLNKILKDKQQLVDQVQRLLQETNDKLVVARQESADAWTSSEEDKKNYMSKANNLWLEIIKNYNNLYRLAVKDMYSIYMQALDSYAQAYVKFVPQKFCPDLGALIIFYQLYILSLNERDDTKTVETNMNDFAKNFFTQFKQTMQTRTALDLIKDGLAWYQRLSAYIDCFEEALHKQALVLHDFNITSTMNVLFKQIDPVSKDLIYTFGYPGKAPLEIITLKNPQKLAAMLYNDMASAFFAQKDYKNAYYYYQLAKENFDKIQDSSASAKMHDLYQISYSYALIDSYFSLVIPNEKDNHAIAMMNIQGFSIPEHYELYNYVQEIPAYIPISLTIETLVKEKSDQALKAVQATLLQYAFLLCVDNQLKDNGIAYTDVFNGYELRKNPSLSSDKMLLVEQFIANANRENDALKKRIEEKKSSLHLAMKTDALNKSIFFLSETYKPIPVLALPELPVTSLLYSSFPMVMRYYKSAELLAQTETKIVNLGGALFTSVQNQEIVNKAADKSAQACIAAGENYKRRIQFLATGDQTLLNDPLMSVDEKNTLTTDSAVLKILQKTSKDDMSVKLAEYVSIYSNLQNYTSAVQLYYDEALSIYNRLKKLEYKEPINTLLGDLFVLFGDSAQTFLVGDPRDSIYFWGSNNTYGGILYDIKTAYLKAIACYGKDTKKTAMLLEKAGLLFSNAGTVLTKQKNFFAAILYYALAIGAYKGMNPRNEKRFAQGTLDWLGSYYKGSTQNILQYRNARINPFKVTLSDGKTETLNFEMLLTKGQTGDVAEQELYQNYKTILLDGLIYYTGCSSAAGSLIDNQKFSESGLDAIKKNAVDIISSYTTKYDISFDSFQSIMKWLERKDFELTLRDIFDSLAKQIIDASPKENQREIAYVALSVWSEKLFIAFGQLYMHDYLGGQQPQDQYLGLMQAIKAEEQAIIAPADQWIS